MKPGEKWVPASRVNELEAKIEELQKELKILKKEKEVEKLAKEVAAAYNPEESMFLQSSSLYGSKLLQWRRAEHELDDLKGRVLPRVGSTISFAVDPSTKQFVLQPPAPYQWLHPKEVWEKEKAAKREVEKQKEQTEEERRAAERWVEKRNREWEERQRREVQRIRSQATPSVFYETGPGDLEAGRILRGEAAKEHAEATMRGVREDREWVERTRL